MTLEPSSSIQRFARSLLGSDSAASEFIEALLNGEASRQALIWTKDRPSALPFSVCEPTIWQPNFVDILSDDSRPGQHALHESGAYYCLDQSSIFMAAALMAVPECHELLVDFCASPGGKGIYAWRRFQPACAIFNELVDKRAPALISNLKRCGVRPCFVTSNDSRAISERAPLTIPLAIIDAPCSGQSLLAKGDRSGGAFHPAAINLNSNRQKKIIANSSKCVFPGGYLAYMTCTFSRDENEAVVEWFLKKFPFFRVIEVPQLAGFESQFADFPCYRLWPQQGFGAGAFTVLLRQEGDEVAQPFSIEVFKRLWKQD